MENLDDELNRPGLAAVLDELVARAERQDTTVDERIQSVRALLSYGRLSLASRLLLPLARTEPQGQFALIRLCRRIRLGQTLLHEDGPEHAAIMAAPVAGARKIIIIFPGQGGRFWGVDRNELFDRRDASFIFLRDDGGFYLDGIRGLGQSYQDCVDELRRLIGVLGGPLAEGEPGRAVYCVGHSIGAYAAMRMGLDLGARAVLAFSGPTDLRLSEGFELSEEYARFRPLLARVSETKLDLLELYDAAPSPPHLILCFGEDHETDGPAAYRMAALQGVSLVPLKGEGGHNTLTEAQETYLYDILLDEMLQK